jgi:hypothetical protein
MMSGPPSSASVAGTSPRTSHASRVAPTGSPRSATVTSSELKWPSAQLNDECPRICGTTASNTKMTMVWGLYPNKG